MANVTFTQLPTTPSAQLTDIITAVQGYSAPDNPGTQVQETLQQVFNLFTNSFVLNYPGNPNGNIAGVLYQLLWDNSNHILYICTATGTALTTVWTKTITLTPGTGITIVQNGNNIQISSSASGIAWNNVTTTSQQMVTDQGYMANNAALVTLNLPMTASFGDSLYILGQGAGGWKISQNGGQQIQIGSVASTVGMSGSVASTVPFNSLALICTVPNTVWTALGAPMGILNIT